MQKYPVKSTVRKELTPERLEALCGTHFDTAARDGPKVSTTFGAIAALSVWSEGKELAVEVTMNPKVPEEVARDTIRRYNQFLAAATGFTSKERAKRLQKAAKAAASGS
ncbi:MAG: DUF5611 family protein [Thermoplasmata archaeon]|nr:DUF5611 family protein [Thermoplasmata archaeon]